MAREIRLVPIGWKHPRNASGYIPLFDRTYEQGLKDWIEIDGSEPTARPKPERFRPEWGENVPMGFCVYENITEGTPISPVFTSENELKDWLMSRHKDKRFVDAFLKYRDSATANIKIKSES